MAVKKTLVDKKIIVRFANGTTAAGKTAEKTVTLSNIALNATDDDMYAAGQAYATLTDRELIGVRTGIFNDLTSDE